MSNRPIEIVHGRRKDVFSRADRYLARLYRPRLAQSRLTAPVVSFSFDDIPDNAATNGAALLESADVRGTFYVAGKLCNRRFRHDVYADDQAVCDLVARGHELGCHTYSHADEQRLSLNELTAEYALSRSFLASIQPGMSYVSHAYPYGSVGVKQKAIAARYFNVCRGVRPGLNVGRIDLMQLRSVPLYDAAYSIEEITGMIKQAAAVNGWLVFYTHDVAQVPSGQGVSIELMKRSIDAALELGCQVETVAAAYRKLVAGEVASSANLEAA